MNSKAPAFKIKTGNLPVLQLHILTTDLARLKEELVLRLSQTPDFFVSTPIVLELSAIAESGKSLDFSALAAFMREHGMCAAGVSGGSDRQRTAAVQSGLGLFTSAFVRKPSRKETAPSPAAPNAALLHTQPELPGIAAEITPEVIPVQPEIPKESHAAAVPAVVRPTLVIDKPVRTGQSIYAEGADLVVLAIANAGSELIADGDIHVYAPLRGKAIAGAHGNESARIFVHKLEAELVSIAGCYKVFEDGIPAEVRGKAAQIHLQGTRLVIEALPG